MAGIPTSDMSRGVYNFIKKSKFLSTFCVAALVTMFIYIWFPVPITGLLMMMGFVGLSCGILSLFFWTDKKWIYITSSIVIVYSVLIYLGTH
jgi:hypothetical protein